MPTLLVSTVPVLISDRLRLGAGRGAARAENDQGTPTQSHVSPSMLACEERQTWKLSSCASRGTPHNRNPAISQQYDTINQYYNAVNRRYNTISQHNSTNSQHNNTLSRHENTDSQHAVLLKRQTWKLSSCASRGTPHNRNPAFGFGA